MVPVRVRARPAGVERGASMTILFRVEAAQAGVPGAAPIVVEETAKFIVP
jgi:hypothetical protein